MRDILPAVTQWLGEGTPVALATVVDTWGSAPRGPGACLAVTADGRMAGSVSGGCVEAAVVEAALDVLATGRPRILTFGVADESAWDVGLACGGTISVWVEALDTAWWGPVVTRLDHELAVVLATILAGPDHLAGHHLVQDETGTVATDVETGAQGVIADAATIALQDARTQAPTVHLPDGAAAQVFLNVMLPAPTLVIVGAVHIAVTLADLAARLGYRVVVVDPRAAFATAERLPGVDRLVVAWPETAFRDVPLTASTAVAVLTHDPKIDDAALAIALASPAFYVGALGSPTTQAKRRSKLIERGLTEDQVARLHGPIGLDIGARSPEEIALAVLAEIVAARNGQPGAKWRA